MQVLSMQETNTVFYHTSSLVSSVIWLILPIPLHYKLEPKTLLKIINIDVQFLRF